MSDSVSAIEYENMEQRYIEMKNKLKKTLQYNERYTIQIQKLNKRLKKLETDNQKLENQVRQLESKTSKDSSDSDVSSSTNLKQDRSSMVEMIQSKNQQITDLLKDIEDIENENLALKETLTEAKDQLSSATVQINDMTETLLNEEARILEQTEAITGLTNEVKELNIKLQQCEIEKRNLKKEFETASTSYKHSQAEKLEAKFDLILQEKIDEIIRLRELLLKRKPADAIDVESDKEIHDESIENEGKAKRFKVALSETEAQLSTLKSEMQSCTMELKESTRIIKNLNTAKQTLEDKIKELKNSELEIKTQLKKAHERCQNMQREVEYANKMTRLFENELLTLKEVLKQNEEIDLVTYMDEIETFKIEKLLHEKQLVSLVKDINKIQEICNNYELENTFLKEQMGLTSYDNIEIDSSVVTEIQKKKNLSEKLQLDKAKAQEEKIKLKLEIKSLKQQMAAYVQKSVIQEVPNTIAKDVNDFKDDDKAADIKALSEENEALRKGLHEILSSVKVKTDISPREIKSDMLESLLKALDVKHISGWYHPAMRLQAELHTMEGVNSELREQLYQARTQLDNIKLVHHSETAQVIELEKEPSEKNTNERTSLILQNVLTSNGLEEIRVSTLKIFALLDDSEQDVNNILENEFNILKNHIDFLHSKCKIEKDDLLQKYNSFEKSILDYKPKSISIELSPEELVNIINKENKKATYAFTRLGLLKDEIIQLRINNDAFQQRYLKQTETLLNELAKLRQKINLKNKESLYLVDQKVVKEIKNSLNENIIKYRQIMSKVEEGQNQRDLELEILSRREVNMKKEISELKGVIIADVNYCTVCIYGRCTDNVPCSSERSDTCEGCVSYWIDFGSKEKLSKALSKLNEETYKHDPNILPLSQKLATAEVQAISEKNRADHTNNLYELVKEQLKKSEEKFAEFSKYGDGLLQKNLVFQERIAELEDNISLYVDPVLLQELQESYNSALKDKEILFKENEELKKITTNTSRDMKTLWDNEKEQELLGLKHEILDLTATSDSKLVIDQLYSDLSKTRSVLRETQLQNDFLKKEVSSWELRYSKVFSENEQERKCFITQIKVLNQKIGIFHNIVMKQRLQYHGCIPLSVNEIFVKRLIDIQREKHHTFMSLQNALDLEQQFSSKMSPTNQENELTNKKLTYLQQKIQSQEDEIQNLEKELFSAYSLVDFKEERPLPSVRRRKKLVREIVLHESLDPEPVTKPQPKKPLVILRNMDSQTENQQEEENEYTHLLTMMKVQLKNAQNQMTIKDNLIAEKERSFADKSKECSEANGTIKTLNQQMKFLENSLKEFRNQEKTQSQAPLNGAGDGIAQNTNFMEEQIMTLRVSIKKTQERLKQKDIEIIKYQTLLKEDRDKHSMAAVNLQQEILQLKTRLVTEQENVESLQEELSVFHKKSSVVEKYVSQVRELETHLAELHTELAQRQIKLDNALQEANRWRQMAQERLLAMQELGKSLNEQHNMELSSYKTDYEKLKELSLVEESPRKPISTSKVVGYIDPEIVKLCKEKDERIEKLTAKLKLMENSEYNLDKQKTTNKHSTEYLAKECENLRAKYDAAISREKILKDEISGFKDHLSKRSNLSARSQKSERSVKEQLQKKITILENEIITLNKKVAQQDLLIENHKLTTNEDYEKWKKQKYWQENCQKFQKKLQEKEEEVRKLQETCSGYRSLIARLEREKINLENRIKALKVDQKHLIIDQDKQHLSEENQRLLMELETLQAKMDMRQQGAGALGAALMQEKLEAQERKIAVLELSAKAPIELRNELEKLQTTMSNLQRKNLCLEAENLELNLALEIYKRE